MPSLSTYSVFLVTAIAILPGGRVEPESKTVIVVRDMRDIVFLERRPAVVGA